MKFDGFDYDSSGVSLVLRCVSFLFYSLLNRVELSLYMQSCPFYDSRLEFEFEFCIGFSFF